MSVAKVVELTAASPTSFEKAIEVGVAIGGRLVGEGEEYRVDLKVTFVMD